MAGKKRTHQEQLDAIAAAEKKLAERKAKLLSKLTVLNSDSAGMTELVEKVKNVAKQNSAGVVDVIRVVSKMMRTGLKFDAPVTKARAPNAPKRGRKPKVAV